MEAYLAAKARLLSYLRPGGVAVVNADDASWRALPLRRRRSDSALSQDVDVRALDVCCGLRGSTWQLAIGAGPCYPVRLPLIGDFNVANALGAAAAAWALGLSPAQIAARLSDVPQVPGRLEILHDIQWSCGTMRTPPSTRAGARGSRALCARAGDCSIWRGRGPRSGQAAAMGAIADKLADVVILTSDNPRTEDPERILDDIEEGMSGPRERIEDRERAVLRALDLAKPG